MYRGVLINFKQYGFLLFAIVFCSVFLISFSADAHHTCRRQANGDATCPMPIPASRPGTKVPTTKTSPKTPVSPVKKGGPILLSPDTSSKPGKKIATCANKMIGQSTADHPETKGGNLGCAVAVSRILKCAGYSVGTHAGTTGLRIALVAHKCFEIIDRESITGKDAMKLKPGDVLLTERRYGKKIKGQLQAGHTGVYYGNGNIISNSSKGLSGSAGKNTKGTIRQNYTLKSWNKKVIPRNPDHSYVFRRKDTPACR